MDLIVDGVNLIIDGLVGAVNSIVAFIPDSPLREPINSIRSAIGSDMLGYLNYFFPISESLTILTGWVVAIGLYYLVSIILRWVNAIS